MKKIILVIGLVSVLSLAAFGVVSAQDTTPRNPAAPGCPNCPFEGARGNGSQIMHEYMVAELAEVLGISPEEFETYREQGLTFYEIASQLNLDLEDLSDEISQVRKEAIEAAFADGALTQEQYEFMLQHAEAGQGFGGGMRATGGPGRQSGGNFGGSQGGRMFGGQNCRFDSSIPTE